MAIPTPHVLGLSGNDTAAQIAMHTEDSIVASIRRTGERIQETALRSMTNRELKGFGQEASTLDPNSPTFVPALLGLAGKYPMASQSPAGRAMIESALIPAQNNFLLRRDAANNAANLAEAKVRGGANPFSFHNTGNGLFKANPKTGEAERVPGTEPSANKYKNIGGFAFNEGTGEWLTPPDMTPAQKARFEETKRFHMATEDYRNRSLDVQGGRVQNAQSKLEMEQIQGKISSLDRDAASLRQTLKTLPKNHPDFQSTRQRLANTLIAQDEARTRLDEYVVDPLPTPDPFSSGLGGGIPTGPTPMVPDAASAILPPPGGIKQLDAATLRKIREEVGGDREKARARARELGYNP